MEKKYIEPLDFKQKRYIYMYKDEYLKSHPLYKCCWKKKSLVLTDEKTDEIIGYMFMQHTPRMCGYEGHGFQMMKLEFKDDVRLEDYIEDVAALLYYKLNVYFVSKYKCCLKCS